jgi:hypothetical protein
MTIQEIAQLCHEANRVLCLQSGDDSQRTWAEAETWQRDAACAGVRWRLEHLDAPSSAQHEQWYTDKIADGWVYGPEKDAQKKTHPCLVPFEELPEFQQVKDVLFTAIVRACGEWK